MKSIDFRRQICAFTIVCTLVLVIRSVLFAAPESTEKESFIIPLNASGRELVVTPRADVLSANSLKLFDFKERCLQAFQGADEPASPERVELVVSVRVGTEVKMPLGKLADVQVRGMTYVPISELEWTKKLLDVDALERFGIQPPVIISRIQ